MMMTAPILLLTVLATVSVGVVGQGSSIDTCSFVAATSNWSLSLVFDTTEQCKQFANNVAVNGGGPGAAALNAYAQCSNLAWCLNGPAAAASNWLISDPSGSSVAGFSLQYLQGSSNTTTPWISIVQTGMIASCDDFVFTQSGGGDENSKCTCRSSAMSNGGARLIVTGRCAALRSFSGAASYKFVKMFAMHDATSWS
jgi:hypothetical protein